MVYCTRCGTSNPDNANTCSNCGAPIFSEGPGPYNRHEYRRYYQNEYRSRNRGGGGIGLLIAGLFIVIIGIAALSGFTMFWTYFWPIVLILLGVWILILGLRRNRRYRQPPTA
ncbi:MAG: zinc-ribbon domain-containing protein [Betaproteobacteria bacterium]